MVEAREGEVVLERADTGTDAQAEEQAPAAA
jgi:hypothetical protein